MHWILAQMAVETGIAPSVLANESPRMLWTMYRVLVARSNPEA